MKNVMGYVLMAAAAIAAASPASAAELVIDVAGAQSFANFGTAGNTVRTFNIGAASRITAISYSVNITAFDPSYLSEAVLAFTGSDTAGDGLFLTPGIGDDDPGTASYAGAANLVDLGLDFAVGADGLLRLEWFEDFNDGGISPDAIWNSGTLTLTYAPAATAAVPEPATWAMLIGGFGAMGATLRRRRTAVRFTAA